MNSRREWDDYPLMLDVADLQEITGWGRDAVLAWCNRNRYDADDRPYGIAIKGKSWLVSRDRFRLLDHTRVVA